MTPPSAAAAPAVHPGRTISPGRPLTTAPRPRRVSGPARRPRDGGARARPAQDAGIALGLLEVLGRLSEHRLLDRLIRGRIWIGLLAFALIGIVTLQLGLLKLNAGIGHTLARETTLQRENAALSIENSELAAGELVESSAVRLGMEMVSVGSLRFLTARPGLDASRGAAALSTPLASASSTGAESASASSTAESSAASEGSESSGAGSSESSPSSSSGSESEASKSAASESSASPTSTEPAEERSSQSATAPSAAGGTTEASGGTQPQSSGR
jgi:hypothetical protein